MSQMAKLTAFWRANTERPQAASYAKALFQRPTGVKEGSSREQTVQITVQPLNERSSEVTIGMQNGATLTLKCRGLKGTANDNADVARQISMIMFGGQSRASAIARAMNGISPERALVVTRSSQELVDVD